MNCDYNMFFRTTARPVKKETVETVEGEEGDEGECGEQCRNKLHYLGHPKVETSLLSLLPLLEVYEYPGIYGLVHGRITLL